MSQNFGWKTGSESFGPKLVIVSGILNSPQESVKRVCLFVKLYFP